MLLMVTGERESDTARRRMQYLDFEPAEYKKDLPGLDNMPITFVRRCARHCYRYINGYKTRLKGPCLVAIIANLYDEFDECRRKSDRL